MNLTVVHLNNNELNIKTFSEVDTLAIRAYLVNVILAINPADTMFENSVLARPKLLFNGVEPAPGSNQYADANALLLRCENTAITTARARAEK